MLYLENINKDEVIIITASLDLWMKDIANNLGVDIICTETVWENGRFSGFLNTNCWGSEKLSKLKIKVDIEKYNENKEQDKIIKN